MSLACKGSWNANLIYNGNVELIQEIQLCSKKFIEINALVILGQQFYDSVLNLFSVSDVI